MLLVVTSFRSKIDRSPLFSFFGILLLAASVVTILISSPPYAFAAHLTLAWDPSNGPGSAGYKVYYGTTSKAYSNSIDAGNVTTYTLSGLTQGQTCFIAVTAYDTSNNESGYSNEVSGIPKESTQPYSVDTVPSGLEVVVDGVTYRTPQTFDWMPGSSHTLTVPSPQPAGSGSRCVYSSWSDGGTQSHSVVVPSSGATYTASLSTEYSLTISVIPSGGGLVAPLGVNWYAHGQVVPISAAPNSAYSFSNWSGDLSGEGSTASIEMKGPKSVMANFASRTGALSIAASETWNITGEQGGPFEPSSQTYILKNTGGSLSNWVASQSGHWLSLSSKGGSLGPGESRTITVSVNRSANQLKEGSYRDTVIFSNKGSGSTAVSVTLDVKPRFQTYEVQTNPPGLEFIVDGIGYTTAQAFNWKVGSSHTLSGSSPQSSSPGTQYLFGAWSDGKPQSHTIVVTASKKSYTASFKTQHSLTTSIGSAGRGIVTPSGKTWHNLGQKISVSAKASDGYEFLGWSGDASSNGNPVVFEMTATKNVIANFGVVSGKTVDPRLSPFSLSSVKAGDLRLIGNLESPIHGKKVAGVKTIYGWVLDGEGISKIEFFIDGEYVCDIPYGGIREDVAEAYPDYRNADKSGFALVWNYSTLSEGDHSLQVRVESVRGESLSLSANVWVNKFHGDMVAQANPSELIIPEMKLTVDGITKTYELRLEWSNETQAFEISEIVPK